jgi:hypothetical protein
MIIYTVRYKGIETITNILFVNVDLHILNHQNVRVACAQITTFYQFACLFLLKFELTNQTKPQLLHPI